MALKYIVGSGFKNVADGGTHQFDITGSLELPQETVIGGLRHNSQSFTIASGIAFVRTAGTSQYTVKLISYDNTGANPITHINQNAAMSSRVPFNLTIDSATIGADRTIELTITQLTGTPSEDFSLTLS